MKKGKIALQCLALATFTLGASNVAAQTAPSARAKAVAPRLGPPIQVKTTTSDNDCHLGPDLEPYFQTAARLRDQNIARNPGSEADLFGTTRVNRPWGRLTITVVLSSYETRAVFFREPLSVVVAQLSAQGFGLQRHQRDGGFDVIRGINLDEFSSSNVATTQPNDSRLGQTVWGCGM
jgi:hypothetical protein